MDASDKDGLSRGYGAVLWQPDDRTVRWFRGATPNYVRNAPRTAWTDPGRTAIVFDSERSRRGHLTYAELAEQVARVARGLRELGVGRGDRAAAPRRGVPETVIGRFRGIPRGS